MLVAEYDPKTGWSAPEIKPYGPLNLDPASSCFQYCPNVFEGMKVCQMSIEVHLLSLTHTRRHTADQTENHAYSGHKRIWNDFPDLSSEQHYQ